MENRVEVLGLKSIKTVDLWAELGRRFNVKYGKIQMAFHGGRPSDCAALEMSVNVNDEIEIKDKRTSRT